MGGAVDIAIIGMAGLFPKAPNVAAYWSNILNKVDAVSMPPDEWLGEPKLLGANEKPEEIRLYAQRGGFLGDLSRFDPRPFGAMPISVQGGEPDQFLALKCAQGALDDAGYGAGRDFDRHRTGVILGHGIHANRANVNGIQHALMIDQILSVLEGLYPDTDEVSKADIERIIRKKLPGLNVDATPGLVPNMMTGRICNRLDFMGPNYIIDAACASTTLSIEAAVNELRNRRADLMLAGGVNTTTSTLVYAVFCKLGALSRSENVRPFSGGADGTLLGEGQGIFVLKRLEDALKDDDRIYAVIKSVGAASDGRSSGLMAPRMEGEALAIARAYDQSGIDPATIDLIEAHGTGIPLGDKTEVSALRSVFGDRTRPYPHIALGSVKSMIGHCIPAAGAASIIKTAMALHEKILPPMLCDAVSPTLGIETTPFYINTKARPWLSAPGSPRRAGVNAFGFGGINSHVILEQSPQAVDGAGAAFGVRRQSTPELFFFRAPDRPTLIAKLTASLNLATSMPETTAAFGRHADELSRLASDGDFRLAIVANSAADLAAKLKTAIDKAGGAAVDAFNNRNGIFFRAKPVDGKIAFLFPGEHSQYQGMLEDVALNAPSVRRWLDRLEGLYGEARAMPHRHLLFPPPTVLSPQERDGLAAQLAEIAEGSEAVFFADMAYFKLLTTLGVRADMMMGHSTGENAALIAAKAARMNDDETCAYIKAMNAIFSDIEADGAVPKGVLLNIGASTAEDFAAALAAHPNIHFTMDNCPNQKIVFADEKTAAEVSAMLTAKGAICARLPLTWAYHTDHVRPLAERFRTLFEEVSVGEPTTQLYSCSTAAPFPKGEAEIRATVIKQYTTRVRFTEAINRMHADGARLFIEVGAGNALSGFVRDILGDREFLSLSCDNPKRDSLTGLMTMLAQLYVAGRFSAAAAIPDRADQAAPMAEPFLPSHLPLIRLDENDLTALRDKLGAPRAARINSSETMAGGSVDGAHSNGAHANDAAVAAPTLLLSDWSRLIYNDCGAHVVMARLREPLTSSSDFAALAALWISDDEQAFAAAQIGAKSIGRQQEWLLGRIAAKKAALEYLGRAADDPRSLSILPDGEGRPVLMFASNDVEAAPEISITHKNGVALAAAAGVHIGIDLEHLTDLRDPRAFAERILSEDELSFADAADDFNRAIALFWSLKEASAKAMRLQFVGQERAFAIEALNLEARRAEIAFAASIAPVSYVVRGDYVCSLARFVTQ